jgi:chromosome segregation ATPase
MAEQKEVANVMMRYPDRLPPSSPVSCQSCAEKDAALITETERAGRWETRASQLSDEVMSLDAEIARLKGEVERQREEIKYAGALAEKKAEEVVREIQRASKWESRADQVAVEGQKLRAELATKEQELAQAKKVLAGLCLTTESVTADAWSGNARLKQELAEARKIIAGLRDVIEGRTTPLKGIHRGSQDE